MFYLIEQLLRGKTKTHTIHTQSSRTINYELCDENSGGVTLKEIGARRSASALAVFRKTPTSISDFLEGC